MENYIVKFKNELKQYQISRKRIIKECEIELDLLEQLSNLDSNSTLVVGNPTILLQHLRISSMIYSVEQLLNELDNITNKRRYNKKKKQALFEKMKEMYKTFYEYVGIIKKEHITTQNIINAFENDKIKDPINNMEVLFEQLKYTTLNIKEISRIIGMAISFNSQYAKRNKNHSIENIDIINKLSEYYNQDGSFKYNTDILTFKKLMEKLFENSSIKNLLYNLIFKSTTHFTIENLVDELVKSNRQSKNNKPETTYENDNEIKENYTISPETRKALQELRKYYKNGTIIAIPENLEEFKHTLEKANLDEKEIKYIMSLIEKELYNRKNNAILKNLTPSEQIIYERSVNLLDSFNHSNGDTYALKQYIEELQTILEILKTEDDEDLLKQIPNIIEQLSAICNKYTIEDEQSTNRFIFLLNKNGIPYICDDIDELDPIYRKAINSLIPKIDKANQTNFNKILSNEELPYNMYEVLSPRAHVSFIEVDSGIYVIMGANIPRNGYKEFNNRLKANQEIIKRIEQTVKNPETRNAILTANEEYLPIFTETANLTPGKKLTRKAHN